MLRKVVISGQYGSGLFTAWNHIPTITRYDFVESRTMVKAVEEQWEWRRLISALLDDGFDRGYIFDMEKHGWFPRGRPIVVEADGPYQIHSYDGLEYVVEQSVGYWRK